MKTSQKRMSQDEKRSPITPAAAQPVAISARVRRLREQLGEQVPQATVEKLAGRMAITKAAAAIHRSPGYVMDMVNAGLVKAYRIGGSLNRPWLAVDLSELLAAIDRESLYVPPPLKMRRPMRRRIEYEKLDTFAASI